MSNGNWIEVCRTEEIDRDDVIRFDHDGKTFAIYRTAKDAYYATDGYCTHQRIHLAEGLVIGTTIECPKHNGRFDFTTGQVKKAPACVDLCTYPVRVDGSKVFIQTK